MNQRAQRRILAALVGLGTLTALLTGVAVADDGSAVFGALDLIDSTGITISQYQLSIDTGGVTNPGQVVVSLLLTMFWDGYRYTIGLIAFLLDWTVGMEWAYWIVGPVNDIAAALRSQILKPLGLTSVSGGGAMAVIFTLAGVVVAWHFARGRTARALGEVLVTAFMAAMAVTVFASPVALFVGDRIQLSDPIRVAQRVGADLANLINGSKISDSPMPTEGPRVPRGNRGGPKPTDGSETNGQVRPPKNGQMIVDTFIRPVHQTINYGKVIDTEVKKCRDAYDKALKDGPHANGAPETREAIGRCDKSLEDFAKSISLTNLIGGTVYTLGAALVAVVVIIFTVLLAMAVLSTAWAALKLLIHAPIAIIPGGTRGPMIQDLIDIGMAIVYLVTSFIALGVVVRLVNEVFRAQSSLALQIKFLAASLMLVAGAALMIVNYVMHRRGARTLGQRLRDKLRQTTLPVTSMGDKVGAWLTKPAFGTAAGGPGFGYGGGRYVGGAPGMIAGRRLNRITASNAFQLAALAGTVATGGAALGLSTAKLGASALAGAGRAASRAASASGVIGSSVVEGTRDSARVYQAIRNGAQRATTGDQRTDSRLTRIAGIANAYQRYRAGQPATTNIRMLDDVLQHTADAHNLASAYGGRVKEAVAAPVRTAAVDVVARTALKRRRADTTTTINGPAERVSIHAPAEQAAATSPIGVSTRTPADQSAPGTAETDTRRSRPVGASRGSDEKSTRRQLTLISDPTGDRSRRHEPAQPVWPPSPDNARPRPPANPPVMSDEEYRERRARLMRRPNNNSNDTD